MTLFWQRDHLTGLVGSGTHNLLLSSGVPAGYTLVYAEVDVEIAYQAYTVLPSGNTPVYGEGGGIAWVNPGAGSPGLITAANADQWLLWGRPQHGEGDVIVDKTIDSSNLFMRSFWTWSWRGNRFFGNSFDWWLVFQNLGNDPNNLASVWFQLAWAVP